MVHVCPRAHVLAQYVELAAVRAEIVGDSGTIDTVINLHGDGSESARTLELKIGDVMDEGRVRCIRFTFPED